MVATIASAGLKVLIWGFAAVGLLAVLLTVLIASPVIRPPELASISDARKSVDFSGLPGLERFQARDGSYLGFRHYSAIGPASGRVAIVIHGSSGSSGTTIHALSAELAAKGVETYAIDVRGHGTSGTRGDVGYIGQLEDDLADFVGLVRRTSPTAPLTLIGHSSGGGFALRVAGSPIQGLFARTVLLAPYLGYNAPTSRPNSGGWANPDIPRIIALMALRKLGIDCCDALPVLAFAVPANSEQRQVAVYTGRLQSNFGTHFDFRADLATATRPLTIFAGANDELMLSDHYAEAVRGAPMPVNVRLIDGVNHMGIVSNPEAISVIADDVAKSGADS